VAANYGVLVPANLAWLALAAIGLWRGAEWARHLVLWSWVALGIFVLARALPQLTVSAIASNGAILAGSSLMIWWYLFHSRACVAFFRRRTEHAV
jgi:hypothetical protein